jgi:hypothetical protein
VRHPGVAQGAFGVGERDLWGRPLLLQSLLDAAMLSLQFCILCFTLNFYMMFQTLFVSLLIP